MKKVVIIGHFGGKEKFYDGQTVKTMNLDNLLASCSNVSVRRVDTHCDQNNKFKLLINTLKAYIVCEHIFLLVSVNGMKFYLPFFHYVFQCCSFFFLKEYSSSPMYFHLLSLQPYAT